MSHLPGTVRSVTGSAPETSSASSPTTAQPARSLHERVGDGRIPARALAASAAVRALYGALIAHRSHTWKLALTIAGLGLGIEPALAGRPLGYVGVIVGGLASASLVADLAEQHGWFSPRPRRRRRRRAPAAPVGPGRLTELDQAALHLTTLRAAHAWLVRAASASDVHAQHTAATDAALAAGDLRDALAVVLKERSQLDHTP